MMSSCAVVQSPSSFIHYAPRTHFVLKDSTRGSRPNFKRRPAALCRETAPSVPHQSAFIRNRGRNFLSSFIFFSLSLFLAEPRRRTEDRSSSRMLWPSSSASKEVSGSTQNQSAHAVCSHLGTYTSIPPPAPPASHLPLLSIMCTRMSGCG